MYMVYAKMGISLSILVPVYNVEKYLRRCLDSIVSQTYKDFEVILVNDGSIDESGNICDEYAKKYDNIKVIHKDNGGLASARRAGILASRGRYFGFVDSDDYVESYMFERLMQPIIHNNQIDISIGGHVVDEMNGEIKNNLCFSEPIIYDDKFDALRDMFEGKRFVWSLCDKVYARQLLCDEAILDNWPYGHGEDTYINEKIFNKARRISFSPIYGYHYCMHADSMMHADFNTDRLNILNFYSEYMEKYEYIDKNIFEAVWNLFYNWSVKYIKEMERADSKYEKEIAKYKVLLKYWSERVQIDIFQKTYIDFFCMSMEDRYTWNNIWMKKIYTFCHAEAQEDVYIYGTGKFAMETYDILERLHIKIRGFVETIPSKRIFMEYPVSSVKDVAVDAKIVLGLNYKNSMEVEKKVIAEYKRKFSMWQYLSYKDL